MGISGRSSKMFSFLTRELIPFFLCFTHLLNATIQPTTQSQHPIQPPSSLCLPPPISLPRNGLSSRRCRRRSRSWSSQRSKKDKRRRRRLRKLRRKRRGKLRRKQRRKRRGNRGRKKSPPKRRQRRTKCAG